VVQGYGNYVPYFFAIGLPQQFPGLVLVLPHAAHLYVSQLAPLPPQHEHPPIFISSFEYLFLNYFNMTGKK